MTENKYKMEEELSRTLCSHGYQIIRPIGEGGTCTVFLVNSLKYSGEEFVVKQIPNTNRETTKMSEIKSLTNLSSPNIINMYEYFFDDSYLYIVLEYCPGGTIMDIIDQNGPINAPRLYQLCHDIIAGLQVCHMNQIAHLDIKPQNILIDKYGRPKIADFGLSLFLAGTLDLKSASQYAGSRVFMAPEIFQKQTFDPFAADIWSLGITFYLMATGESPWGEGNSMEIEKAIPMGVYYYPRELDSKFVKILRAMIDVNPSKRVTIDKLAQVDIFRPNTLSKERATSTSKADFNIFLSSSRLPNMIGGMEDSSNSGDGANLMSRKLTKKYNSQTDQKNVLTRDSSSAISAILVRQRSIPISKKRRVNMEKLSTFYE